MTQKTKKTTIINWAGRMLRKKLPVAIIFILAFSLTGKTQVSDIYGINEMKNLFDAHQHQAPRYSNKSSKPKNELEFIMASGFNVYKAFFSSQDNPSCVFHPSCSEYSVQALQQKGLLLGTLYTFDRLSRCHRLVKSGQYVFDPSKQRFYDPVR